MQSFRRLRTNRMHTDSSQPLPVVVAVTSIFIIGLTYLLAGCESPMMQSEDDISLAPEENVKFEDSKLSGSFSPAELNKKIAAVREVTAPFHRIEAAIEAGWSEELTPCLEHPDEGGMGYHYANPDLINDEWNILEPEALLYEPQKNGRLRLVGVEYIVPFDEHPEDADPPVLFGQEFHQNFEADIWALHVWVWRNNPSGMFADWNPMVSCKFD